MHVALAVHQLRPYLVTAVRLRYPALCRSRAEDAASDVVALAVQDPLRFEAALARDGREGLRRLAACAARRAARDQVRRRSARYEVGVPFGDPSAACAPGQEVVAALPRDLVAAFGGMARRIAPTQQAALVAALLDKLETGAADTDLALKHGVRREYLNRAWREATTRWL